MDTALPHYEGWNARSKRKIALTPEVRAKLLRISPATIDRLLRVEKRKLLLRGLSHTKKPTGTLMLQIPIRTFSEWQNVPVGTLGMEVVDLIATVLSNFPGGPLRTSPGSPWGSHNGLGFRTPWGLSVSETIDRLIA